MKKKNIFNTLKHFEIWAQKPPMAKRVHYLSTLLSRLNDVQAILSGKPHLPDFLIGKECAGRGLVSKPNIVSLKV